MSEDSQADNFKLPIKQVGGEESAIFKEVIPRMQVKIQTDRIRHTIQPEETWCGGNRQYLWRSFW